MPLNVLFVTLRGPLAKIAPPYEFAWLPLFVLNVLFVTLTVPLPLA